MSSMLTFSEAGKLRFDYEDSFNNSKPFVLHPKGSRIPNGRDAVILLSDGSFISIDGDLEHQNFIDLNPGFFGTPYTDSDLGKVYKKFGISTFRIWMHSLPPTPSSFPSGSWKGSAASGAAFFVLPEPRRPYLRLAGDFAASQNLDLSRVETTVSIFGKGKDVKMRTFDFESEFALSYALRESSVTELTIRSFIAQNGLENALRGGFPDREFDFLGFSRTNFRRQGRTCIRESELQISEMELDLKRRGYLVFGREEVEDWFGDPGFLVLSKEGKNVFMFLSFRNGLYSPDSRVLPKTYVSTSCLPWLHRVYDTRLSAHEWMNYSDFYLRDSLPLAESSPTMTYFDFLRQVSPYVKGEVYHLSSSEEDEVMFSLLRKLRETGLGAEMGKSYNGERPVIKILGSFRPKEFGKIRSATDSVLLFHRREAHEGSDHDKERYIPFNFGGAEFGFIFSPVGDGSYSIAPILSPWRKDEFDLPMSSHEIMDLISDFRERFSGIRPLP